MPIRFLNHLRYFLKDARATHAAKSQLKKDWQRYQNDFAEHRKTGQKNNLIVSLTSYPPRYPDLHLTLQSLLVQSFLADRIILWIAHEDIASLPLEVTRLTRFGLEICSCDNLKSYKKLIPALAETPDAAFVTADDDTYYWRDWLKEMVDQVIPGKQEVICHRMHRITLADDGLPRPYDEWELQSTHDQASNLNFPTGIGGVLYPPGIFYGEVLDIDHFTQLCPNGDDIWFYWMVRKNGGASRKVPQDRAIHCWTGSQDAALWKNNMTGKFNDTQINAMIDHYGFFGIRKSRPR